MADRPARLQTVSMIASTVAAVIASGTAIVASIQATRAVQGQAQMAIFQRQLDSCLGYSHSARGFGQKFSLVLGVSMLRLKDKDLSPDKDKTFTDTVTQLTEASEKLVEATDEIRLVVPDPQVSQSAEQGHRLATQAVFAWQAGYKDAAALSRLPDTEQKVETAFAAVKLSCRTYLADVMGGRQAIR